MELETYQDLASDEPKEAAEASFATIAQVFADGVTLRFDGLDAPTTKRYKVNSFVVFRPGDRVRVIKDSGTYVVEYPVGNPRTAFAADTAADADHALRADSAAHADSADSATQAETALSAQSLSGTPAYATSAGTAANLWAAGQANSTRIWLNYSGGRFYIGNEGGSYRQISTS